MSERERTLAIILGTLLFLGVGVAAYFLILQPLQAAKNQQAALEKEVGDLKLQADKMRTVVPKLAEAKRRSLPADPKPAARPGQPATPATAAASRPEASSAKLEYSLLLTRLLAKAKIPQEAISIKERVMDARGIPVMPNTKRPAYTRYAYDIEARNIDMWEVHDFLTAYYQVDLLHQITSFSLKRDENTNATRRKDDRKDLTLTLTTEAIMIDGVESRPSLVPVPSGFAAVGSWSGYDAIAFNPNPAPGRFVNPFRTNPVLAFRELPTRNKEFRDYSYVVLKDMFHGHLPPPPKPSFDRVSDVTVKMGEPISPVKLSLGGVLPPGPIKWDVKYDGNPKLLPPGSVKLDPSKQSPSAALSFKLPEGESGYATVNVVATLADGKELKNSLRVTVTPPSPKDEISAYIFLVNTTVRNDGSASAMIRDRYNPFDYEVRANREGVKVQKYWYLTATQRKEDGATTPQIVIGDENLTATKRVLKVVAVDDDGIIVIDVTPPQTKPGGVIGIPIGPAGAGGGNKVGGFPGGGAPPGPGGPVGPGAGKGFGPGGTPKMAEPPSFIPLAGVVGTASALIPPTPVQKLYRWSIGKSLKQMTEVPKDEADRIMLQAGKAGPVGTTAREPVAVVPANPTSPMPPPMVPPVAPNTPVADPTIPVAPSPRVAEPVVPEAPAPRPVMPVRN